MALAFENNDVVWITCLFALHSNASLKWNGTKTESNFETWTKLMSSLGLSFTQVITFHDVSEWVHHTSSKVS